MPSLPARSIEYVTYRLHVDRIPEAIACTPETGPEHTLFVGWRVFSEIPGPLLEPRVWARACLHAWYRRAIYTPYYTGQMTQKGRKR